MAYGSQRGRQDASTPAAIVPASSRLRAHSFRSRGHWLGFVALLALALPSSAAPALRGEAGSGATAGTVTLLLLGADPRCLHKAGDGILVTIGDHRIVVAPGVVRFDGAESSLAGLRRVVVDASGWGLTVTADGRIVAKIDELEGLEEAAARGNSLALNDLAVRLATGNGIARDPERAARLYRQAAEAGLPLAARNLAMLERSGGGEDVAAAASSTPQQLPIEADAP
ncbi:tetratricopeptide repeat protein [Jiella pelagia]|uniref:Sel1 repeat family protein n=1 Tax=Jiella pelagia TaxID=2986949 RepID=A0ABY7BUV5_9HYPH|nr:hypothetical protein [Jiella pelagia]WAP67088.1 hypothetical protein OH818_15870 [Jiella pelagia]